MRRALRSGEGALSENDGCCPLVCASICSALFLIMGLGIVIVASGALAGIVVFLIFGFMAALLGGYVCCQCQRRAGAEEKSLSALYRNCRLLVEADAFNGQGRLPATPENFEFKLKGLNKKSYLTIIASKELYCIRLVQLLKFADPRASVYLNTPAGLQLLTTFSRSTGIV